MKIVSKEEFLQGGTLKVSSTDSTAGTPQGTVLKDLGIGFAKGAGETVRNLSNLGRKVTDPLLGVLDPTRTIDEYRAIQPQITEDMTTASNPTQKVGKAGEFLVELLFPFGKAAEVTGLAKKTSDITNASLKGLGTRINKMEDSLFEAGSNTKNKLFEIVGNLDSKTRNALKKTERPEFESMLDIGRKAMEADGNVTPYEFVGNKIIKGLQQIKDRASSVGEAKSRVMETAKIGFNKVGNIAQRSALNVQKSFSGMKLDPSDQKVVSEFQTTLKKLGSNPTLRDVDATIDLLQDRLYKTGRSNVLDVTDRVTGKLRSELGALNEQVRTLGGTSYAKLNKDYGDIAELMKELNARLGKEGSSAGALIKRLFSPSDARTKELFKELQKLTGQDYFKDARLAKFVMEALDDPRAKSLLEELPSPAGVIKGAYDYGRNKLEIPIKAARSIIEKR